MTQFRLVTTGTGNPSLLSLAQLPTNGQSAVSAQVVPGLSYRLDGSRNLFDWISLSTNSAITNQLQWLEPTRHPVFFYRTVVLP